MLDESNKKLKERFDEFYDSYKNNYDLYEQKIKEYKCKLKEIPTIGTAGLGNNANKVAAL